MAKPIRSTRLFRYGGKLFSLIFALSGLQRLIGNDPFGLGQPRSIMEPVDTLEDEWKCTCCNCSIKVTERDLITY